jgi:hypothetical protein
MEAKNQPSVLPGYTCFACVKQGIAKEQAVWKLQTIIA